MTRPRIWKDPKFGALPWCVTNPYKPAVWGLCTTWEEAMEYVQEKLENPFPLDLDGVTNAGVEVLYEGGIVFLIDRSDDDTIALKPNDWRPLARALTRLADLAGVK